MAAEAIEFHLLGYAYRALESPVHTHGPYQSSEVYALIEQIQPDTVWFPALWPETYSYTLSVALHCGLPVVVPDIGAFPERVAGRSLSAVMPWDLSLAEWQGFWREVLRGGALPAERMTSPAISAEATADNDFYSEHYLQSVAVREGQLANDTLDSLAANYHLLRVGLSRRERLLRAIWRLSRTPFVAKCVALVPFRLKQSFKRRLSARPMHDIVYKE